MCVPTVDGFPARAARVLDEMGVRYSHRERAYIATDAQVRALLVALADETEVEIPTPVDDAPAVGDFVALEGTFLTGFVRERGTIGRGRCQIDGYLVDCPNGKTDFFPADQTRLCARK